MNYDLENLKYIADKINQMTDLLKHYRRQSETLDIVTDDLRRGIMYIEQFLNDLVNCIRQDEERIKEEEEKTKESEVQ